MKRDKYVFVMIHSLENHNLLKYIDGNLSSLYKEGIRVALNIFPPSCPIREQ